MSPVSWTFYVNLFYAIVKSFTTAYTYYKVLCSSVLRLFQCLIVLIVVVLVLLTRFIIIQMIRLAYMNYEPITLDELKMYLYTNYNIKGITKYSHVCSLFCISP